MSNSQIEKDPVREDILNGARELFKRFGFKKTTMEDIARQIGKSKSALYYYYKTKEEIFEAVVLHDMDIQRSRAEEEVEKVESAAEKFRVFFTSILGNVRERANDFSIFRADFQENPLFILNISRQRDSYLEEYLKNILIWGISRGEVKVLTNVEMEVWARMINWSMRTIGGKMFMEDENAYLDEHLGFMADSLFGGVEKYNFRLPDCNFYPTNPRTMLENLLELVKQHAGNAIVNNPSIPNEKNGEAVAVAGESITSGLQQMISQGGLKQVLSLFSGGQQVTDSNPAVQQISGNVVGGLMEKLGLNQQQAGSVASGLVPGVLQSLVQKVNDPSDGTFNIQSIFNSLSGGSTSGIDVQGLLNKFKGSLDQDGDGDVDLQDLTAAFSGGGLMDKIKGLFGR